MTTIADDQQSPAEVRPAPSSTESIQTAGETGSKWYDFNEAGQISSAVWDQTISNTDDYQYGEVLFAINSNPAIQPADDLPKTMCAHLVLVFQQMVFSCINYEIICSKGSLTNGKFILAFIPGMTVEEFNSFPRGTRLNICDRQSQKVIFSPNPNQAQVLKAHWSHLTSICRTDESQGVIALLVYQQVVANIADGGTNEIRLTCRMSTEGLKLRYPMPPGTNDADDTIITREINSYEPQNPQTFDQNQRWVDRVTLPLTSINTNPTPLMVAIPTEIVNELPLENVINAQNKEGKELFSKKGCGVFTEIYRRTFTIITKVGEQPAPSSHQITVNIIDFGNKSINFTIKYPWVRPEGSTIFDRELGFDSLVVMICDQDTGETATVQVGPVYERSFDNGHAQFVFVGTVLTPGDGMTILGEAGMIDANTPRLLDVHFNDPGLYLVNSDEDFMPEGPLDSHTIFWSEQPLDADPAIVLDEILSGIGLPAVCNLVNQTGASDQGRSPEPLSADLVVGEPGTRDFFETIGQVLHTAEQFAPLLLSFLKAKDAIIVEATVSNPIHYVPTGGEQKRKFGKQSVQNRIPEHQVRTLALKANLSRLRRHFYQQEAKEKRIEKQAKAAEELRSQNCLKEIKSQINRFKKDERAVFNSITNN